jgi:hypothetical protein
MRTFKYLIPLLLCLFISAYAQSPVLNKLVTLHYRDAKVKDVLLGLEKKYGIKFYYANNVVPLYARVNINMKDQPLSKALEEIFRETEISFVAVEEKIVLKKDTNKPKDTNKKKEIKKQSLEDSPSRESTASTSIDPNSLRPAFTLLEVQSVPTADLTAFEQEELQEVQDSTLLGPEVQVKRKNKLTKWYMAKMDSLSKVGDEGGRQELKAKFSTAMKKMKTKIGVVADSIKSKTAPKRIAGDTSKLVSSFQATFVYPIGTNGPNAEYVTNKASLNGLTGYAYALEGVEVGGLVNVEKAYVKGAQFAGIANVVQGETNAGQFAGVINVVGEMVNGAQVAGVANINKDSMLGFQAAGIVNHNQGSIDGGQFAGIVNVNEGSLSGFQAAGISNINKGPSRGVLVGGILNLSKEEHKGVQIAGIFNKASRVTGTQIGLINMADTVTGATLGLINLVKNGYNKVEVYGAEGLYANVGFRFGTKKFHTILAMGAQPSNDPTLCRLGAGIGFGSKLNLSPRSSIHLDLMSTHINEGYDTYTDKLNLLNQFKVHYEVKLVEHLRFFGGPTFNVMVSQFHNPDGSYGSQLVKNTFSDETYTEDKEGDPVNVKMWIGFNAGLRF